MGCDCELTMPMCIPGGITVDGLRQWLDDYVRFFGGSGGVWIGTSDGRSNEAVEVIRLNDNDVLISPRQYKKGE